MKAVVLRENSLQVEEWPKPELAAGEALVKIHYAALNHRDQWIRVGQYAKIKLPCVPGSDGMGVVEAVGSNDDAQWLWQKVIINPNINWGDHPVVQGKDFEILGMPSQGTLAEYVKVNVDRLSLVPHHLTDEEAAALPLAGVTAYTALFHKGDAQKGHNILISGVGGGVAQMTFLYAVAIRANVWVTSGKDAVIQQCMEMGAQGGANYNNPEAMKQMAKSIGGFDIIIDSAGGEGMNLLINMMKPGGKLVFYGATKGIAPLNLRAIFWNHLHLIGSTMGSDAVFTEMVQFVDQHSIRPIIDKVFTLEEAEKAFDRMAAGQQFGKIIVKVAE